MTTLKNPAVCIMDCSNSTYPSAPFHPPERYPEFPFGDGPLQPDNYVYAAVREMFQRLGMDHENFGTPAWNPLGEIIRPGDKVVLKPNLVISEHELGLAGIEASTVHGSVIRPFVDYAWIALKGEGRITIGDSPIKEVDFERIIDLLGIQAMLEYFGSHHPQVPLEVVDYRDLRAYRRADGTIVGSHALAGDKRGYTTVDLGRDSMFYEIAHLHKRFRSTAAVYENAVSDAHTSESHKYSFANTVLESDVFICLAKLKTHRKAGVTLSLKNLVGLTNEKRWLPHHRVGTIAEGGDMLPEDAPVANRAAERIVEFFKSNRFGRFGFTYVLPVLRRIYGLGIGQFLARVEKRDPIQWHEGDWHGNDTVWRMVLDLNQILLYSDKQGRLHDAPQKRYFSCIDGIIAGEKEGPLNPRPKKTGLLIGGFNPVAVDLACIRLMGYDYRKIPLMTGVDRMARPLNFESDIDQLWKRLEVTSNCEPLCRLTTTSEIFQRFEPCLGWTGHIELDEAL